MPDRFEIHCLDMGHERYGDCLVVRVGDRTLLVDGGHPQDIDNRGFGFPSIPEQLAAIFGPATPRPYPLDLLVVTHCHADHIGCLPALVKRRILAPKWALVADPVFRWGPEDQDAADGFGALSERLRDLLDAAAEEGSEDPEGIAADGRLPPPPPIHKPYLAMLGALAAANVRVVRYGTDPVTELNAELADIGFEILGPTKKHLQICAEQIQGTQGRDASLLAGWLTADAGLSDRDLIKRLRRRRADADAGGGSFSDGAALNCQSIVFSLAAAGRKALFAGDMQFVEPDVHGLDSAMSNLVARIATSAEEQSFNVIKIAHHASHNAWNAALHQRVPAPLLLISGGQVDPDHPDPGVLEQLSHLSGITWYRTDRNGRIDVDLLARAVSSSRGHANDATPNPALDGPLPPLEGEGEPIVPEAPPANEAPAPMPEAIQRRTTPAGDVEITARFPYGGRVVITIDMEGSAASAREDDRPFEPSGPKAPRRPGEAPPEPLLLPIASSPSLLFVTDPEALAANTDRATVTAFLDRVRSLGHGVLPLEAHGHPPSEIAQRLHAAWQRLSPRPKAIVLLGGYDVVPSFPVAVWKPDEDSLLADDPTDFFTIWSDDPYASWTDQDFPDVPLSRVPDAHSSELLRTVLQGLGQPPPVRLQRTAIYNVNRPFARTVVPLIPGEREPWISEPTTTDLLASEADGLAAGAFYFMLHGNSQDTRIFEGEWRNRRDPPLPTAFSVERVPSCPGSVVFAGCCWGALTVRELAIEDLPRPHRPTARAIAESVALRFLASGANAFVGCTGAHFSPLKPPYNYRGAPLHQEFWRHLTQGHPPAAALWHAKRLYHARKPFPHPEEEPRGRAEAIKERKIRSQFQCLGVGW